MSRIREEVKGTYEYDSSIELMLKPFLQLYDVTFMTRYIKGKSKLLYFF